MNEEVVIINNEAFYRIPNGTSYDYAPIPKGFKPYFERLQQENQQLQNNWNELKKWLREEIDYCSGTDDMDFISMKNAYESTMLEMQELERNNES